jgi:hypothetical protein
LEGSRRPRVGGALASAGAAGGTRAATATRPRTSRSRNEPDDPEEAELAKEFLRRDRRRCRAARLIVAIDAPIGAVLILADPLAGAAISIAFGALFLLLGLFPLNFAHQVGRALRETIQHARHY